MSYNATDDWNFRLKYLYGEVNLPDYMLKNINEPIYEYMGVKIYKKDDYYQFNFYGDNYIYRKLEDCLIVIRKIRNFEKNGGVYL